MTTLGPLSHKMTKPGAMVGPFSAAARNARARRLPRPTAGTGVGGFLPPKAGTGVGGFLPPKAGTGVGAEVALKTAKAEEKAALKLFKNPKKAAMIGTGLAVAASVAMNRRGKGASSGRQSIYRY